MKRHLSHALLLVVTLFHTSCNKEELERIDANRMQLQVTARGNHPDLQTDLFPSFLYLADGLKQYYKEEAGKLFTDQVLQLSFINPSPGTTISLDIQESNINEPSHWQYTTGNEETVQTPLPVKWKYHSLKQWNETIKVPLVWDVKLNGYEAGTLSQSFICHDIRRFPERIFTQNHTFVGSLTVDSDGAIYPAALITAYIDENNGRIAQLMQQAVESGAIDRFDGYAQGDNQIINQLGAMWYILLENGLTYGNHYFVPGYWSERHIRKLRSVDEILDSHTGNCIELPSLLIAMCHQAGLNIVSFHVDANPQDHMYMGILNKKGELTYILNPAYLEQMAWSEKTTDERISLAKKQLMALLEVGWWEHKQHEPYIAIGTPHYEQIHFDQVRQNIPSLFDKTTDNEK